ncbi:nucleotide exchange factor GrpE [Rubidibacter lacunae]|nr:nucleotide exchange factor GrpE [Rubidibacter lacunae]
MTDELNTPTHLPSDFPADEAHEPDSDNVVVEALEELPEELDEEQVLAEALSAGSSAIEDEFEKEARGRNEPNVAVADADAGIGSLAELEQLRAQVEQESQQRNALHAQALRIAADFENFRKRTQKEREELDRQVKINIINELLPVIDNFERARAQIKPQTDGEMSIHKSYQSVYKQLVDGLKRMGVSPMRSEGQEFDPTYHEAVMREPTDEYAEGVVIEQLVRGYLLGERVLRHALVKVAVAPEPVIGSETEPVDEASPSEEGS